MDDKWRSYKHCPYLEVLKDWDYKLHGRLTKRELEVVYQASHGHRIKVIADKLNITEKSVKFHLTHIYKKLNVDGIHALVSYTFRTLVIEEY
jgi:two-component system response regulator DegU